ncbi:MAG: hypothetical protein ACI3VS_08490 [Evtepia sp.]
MDVLLFWFPGDILLAFGGVNPPKTKGLGFAQTLVRRTCAGPAVQGFLPLPNRAGDFL